MKMQLDPKVGARRYVSTARDEGYWEVWTGGEWVDACTYTNTMLEFEKSWRGDSFNILEFVA